MTAALRIQDIEKQQPSSQVDAEPNLIFRGSADDPESVALQQFREGALRLLQDCRRWRENSGYKALLKLVVDTARDLIEKSSDSQRIELVFRLMHLLKLVSLVEMRALELATTELQGEVAIMLADDPTLVQIAPKRRATPGKTACRIEKLILKKMNALLAELSDLHEAPPVHG